MYGKNGGNQSWCQINAAGTEWVSCQYLTECSGGGSKILNVPMVHQRWDTPDSFDGSWACGPTSTVMALAFYGKLPRSPIKVSSPVAHSNDFGRYVSEKYTNAQGVTFGRMQSDASGRSAYGAYGTCTEDGMAWAWRIQDYLKAHGVNNAFAQVTSKAVDLPKFKASIDAGKPVIVSTQILGYGHIMIVIGYNTDGSLVVNDPYGNAKVSGWGRQLNGASVTYTWEFMVPKWYVLLK